MPKISKTKGWKSIDPSQCRALPVRLSKAFSIPKAAAAKLKHIRQCFTTCGLNNLCQNAIITEGYGTIEQFGILRVTGLKKLLGKLATQSIDDGGAMYIPEHERNLVALLFWTFECRRKNIAPSTMDFDLVALEAAKAKIAESSDNVDDSSGKKQDDEISDPWKWFRDCGYKPEVLWKIPWDTDTQERVAHGGDQRMMTNYKYAKQLEEKLTYKSEHYLPYHEFRRNVNEINVRLHYCGWRPRREPVEALLRMISKCNYRLVKLAIGTIRNSPEYMESVEACHQLLQAVNIHTPRGSTTALSNRIQSMQWLTDEEWDISASPMKEATIVCGWVEYNNEDTETESEDEGDNDSNDGTELPVRARRFGSLKETTLSIE